MDISWQKPGADQDGGENECESGPCSVVRVQRVWSEHSCKVRILDRGPPGRAGKDDNQEKQLRGQDCEARLAPKLEPGEYSSNSSDMEIRGHHYRAATVETLIGRG